MTQKPPVYVEKAGIIGAPIDYSWTKDDGLHYFADRDQDMKLYESFQKIQSEARFMLGVAITEWIVWRYKNILDIEDPLKRIQAGYACLIDSAYAKNLDFKPTDEIWKTEKAEPLKVAMKLFFKFVAEYKLKHETYFAAEMVNLTHLARHVMPGKSFEEWLKDAVNNMTKQYGEAYSKKSISEMLKTLDPSVNTYLRTPDEMKVKGFKGEPYKI